MICVPFKSTQMLAGVRTYPPESQHTWTINNAPKSGLKRKHAKHCQTSQLRLSLTSCWDVQHDADVCIEWNLQIAHGHAASHLSHIEMTPTVSYHARDPLFGRPRSSCDALMVPLMPNAKLDMKKEMLHMLQHPANIRSGTPLTPCQHQARRNVIKQNDIVWFE